MTWRRKTLMLVKMEKFTIMKILKDSSNKIIRTKI